MGTLIEGRVARILSENCVVLGAGVAAGVKTGMIFVVLAQGEEVVDPDSGEMLGRWELPKGYLRVVLAQERLATCEGWSPVSRKEPEDLSTNVLSAALITDSMYPESWRGTGGAALNVNRSEIAGLPKIGPISVGDIAREVRPETLAAETPTASAAEDKRK